MHTRLPELSCGTSGQDPACQGRKHKTPRFNPWVWKVPWRRARRYSCLENPMDRGAWRATVHRVAKSQTRLNKQECARLAYRMGMGTRTFRSTLWFSFCCAEVYKIEEVTWSNWGFKSSGRGLDGLQGDSQRQETSEDAVTLVVRGVEGWPEAVKEGMDLKWCLRDQ